MDDLLIVRMSDRSKERTARSRRLNSQASLGMNLGLVVGVGLGLVFASNSSNANPIVGMAIGLACGMILGGLFGKAISRKEKPKQTKKHCQGMPIDNCEGESGSPPHSA